MAADIHISVKISPGEIFAGTSFTFVCEVSGSPTIDLADGTLHITSDDGAVFHAASLSANSDGGNKAAEISMTAPNRAGAHSWRAVLPAVAGLAGRERAISEVFTFHVRPHDVSVMVWGINAAVAVGENFSITAGLRCCCGCPLRGRKLQIADQDGNVIQEVATYDHSYPGSEGVYFADVRLTAPPKEGDFVWRVLSAASEEDLSHSGTFSEIPICVAPPPECTVVIKAAGIEGKKPLARATVAMHPFRTQSDSAGIATLRIPKGKYRLLVSAPKHAAESREVDITADYSAEILLHEVPSQNAYSDWGPT